MKIARNFLTRKVPFSLRGYCVCVPVMVELGCVVSS